jgi:hypothetical protein
MCAALGGVDVDQECEDLVAADVKLLNASRVHIVGANHEGITRETIHALASVVRAFQRMIAERPAS